MPAGRDQEISTDIMRASLLDDFKSILEEEQDQLLAATVLRRINDARLQEITQIINTAKEGLEHAASGDGKIKVVEQVREELKQWDSALQIP